MTTRQRNQVVFYQNIPPLQNVFPSPNLVRYCFAADIPAFTANFPTDLVCLSELAIHFFFKASFSLILIANSFSSLVKKKKKKPVRSDYCSTAYLTRVPEERTPGTATPTTPPNRSFSTSITLERKQYGAADKHPIQ